MPLVPPWHQHWCQRVRSLVPPWHPSQKHPYGVYPEGGTPRVGVCPEDQNRLTLAGLVCDRMLNSEFSLPRRCPMADSIIENPILNSPFREPDRHFRFTDDGITNQVDDGRRPSSYFVPIPPPKKKGKQLPVRYRVDEGPDRGERDGQPDPRPRRLWRDGGYGDIQHARDACSSTGPTPSVTAAVLLPGRGPGDDHLPHRSRREVRRHLDARTGSARPTSANPGLNRIA